MDALKIHGKAWEYESHYLGSTERENFEILSTMEAKGWEVMNITGASQGNDVIWFRRKLKNPKKKPSKENPCKHGVENGHMNCIHCGGPV